MVNKIEDLRKAIATSNKSSYEPLLKTLRDDEDINVAGHLMELFYVESPVRGMSGTIEYLANSNGITSVADFNNYAVFYPSDKTIDELEEYSERLYVCAGDASFSDVIHKMLKDTERVPHLCGKHKNKMILLTNKWNDNTFKKNDLRFIKRAIIDELKFYFVVVSDYGLYQVPFLPRDFREDVVSDFRHNEIIGDDGRPEVF